MGAKCIQPARKAAVMVAFAAVCLLCQPVRAADPAAAEVLSAGGRVSVIRDSMEWALFAGSSVQVGELIVTGEDGFAHLQVADGSSFTVYPDSQVVFRKNPGNLKLSLVHHPSKMTLSIGYFYLAHLGHYHLAATSGLYCLYKPCVVPYD